MFCARRRLVLLRNRFRGTPGYGMKACSTPLRTHKIHPVASLSFQITDIPRSARPAPLGRAGIGRGLPWMARLGGVEPRGLLVQRLHVGADLSLGALGQLADDTPGTPQERLHDDGSGGLKGASPPPSKSVRRTRCWHAERSRHPPRSKPRFGRLEQKRFRMGEEENKQSPDAMQRHCSDEGGRLVANGLHYLVQ